MRTSKVTALVAAVGVALACGANVAAALATPAAPELRVPYVDPLAEGADGSVPTDGSGAASWRPLTPPAAPTVPVAAGASTAAATAVPARAAAAPGPTSVRLPQTLSQWVTTTAAATGVPARAVQAYGNATLEITVEQPACRLGWPTLAAIGWIESGHGTHGGAVLGVDGRPSVPIVGPALDGSAGRAGIRATPRSTQWHGDPVWDHAVGPMQFIPSTWVRWGADGDGDGVADPQDVDDAALATARYLCAGGRDLSTWDGWHAAVLSYNHAEAYVQSVYSRTVAYAAATTG